MSETEKRDQCQFYLQRKKRFCRFRPRPGEQYCPEHACVLGIQSERKRIPCPLNPKHNCYEDDLQNHLKKCPASKSLEAMKQLKFFVKDINLSHIGSDEVLVSSGKQQIVKELTDQRLREIISKVNSLYIDCYEEIPVLHLEHSSVKEEFIVKDSDLSLERSFGDQVMLKKELLQQASLVGQLGDLGFLSHNNCFVELGAGKGKLSHWIQRATAECTGNNFILVDRSSVRYKMDNFHKTAGTEGTFHRIKIDIKDLCLGKVPEVQGKSSVIVIGKHLCGGATDMGIHCAVNTLQFQADNKIKILADTVKEASCSRLTGTQNSSPFVEAAKHLLSDCDISNKSCEEIDISERQKEIDLASNGKKIESVSAKRNGNEIGCIIKMDESKGKRVLEKEELDEVEPPSSKMSKIEKGQNSESLPQGIVIALCCHHQCTWDTYIGRYFMREHDVSAEEFDIFSRLSSWATCARTRPRNKNKDKKSDKNNSEEKAEHDKKDDSTNEVHIQTSETEGHTNFTSQEDHAVEDLITGTLVEGESIRDKLSVSQREEIGRRCKRIIDMGRISYLRSKGMTCFLREYVDEGHTPENIVLIATNSIQS